MSVNAGAVYAPVDDIEEFLSPRQRLRRGGGWLAVFLTLVMLVAVAGSVQAADWSDGLNLVESAISIGAILGLLLALTNWGSLFTTIYSLLACVAWVATLLTRGYLNAPDVHTGLIQLGTRYGVWFNNLVQHQSSADNLIFVLQLLLLGWWIGHFAMWMVFRHQRVWLAALPAGVGILFNAYYSPKPLTGYLLLFLTAALMLTMRVELARNEVRWQMARVRYAPDIYIDFLRDGFVFALAVLAMTYLLPTGSPERRWHDLLRPFDTSWHEVQDTWNRAFTNLKYPAAGTVTTFGKTLNLGGPVSLTDRPIFEAQAPERVYWRAAAFDTYTGQQWRNTDTKVLTVDRDKPLPEPEYIQTKEITATVRTLEVGQDVLFTPPQPVRASLPASVDYSPGPPDAGTGPESGAAVSMVRSRAGLARDSVYQVVSRPSDAAPDLLRTDQQPYPDSIRARYLQVPEALPARVRDLAQEIARPYDNPYDRAAAVEAYVRSFPYNSQIAAPPPGMDGVDYFLFDAKQGYCDYYASAMAIMLRVVGVPARFVVGYTPGEPSTTPGAYLVREENAHAWVEVYFPGYGWVQFEPTASQPLLSRPLPVPSPQTTPQPEGTRSPVDRRDREPEGTGADVTGSVLGLKFGTPANPIARWILGHAVQLAVVLGAVLLVVVAVLVLRRRQQRLLTPDRGLVARLFDLLPGWAERLHIPWPASHTPLEHAHALGRAVPEAATPADRLARLFVAQRYGRQDIPQDSLQAAAGDWRHMQPALWRSWLRGLIPVRLPRHPGGAPDQPEA